MDLRSGHPFWLVKNGLLASYPALATDERCEVAVLGGGITGSLIADRLTSKGIDVVLLDKRDIGAGSTAASTSLLQYEIDTELVELSERIGEENAVRSYKLGLEAIDDLQELCSALGDDCGFDRRESLYFASHEKHADRLKSEYAARLRHGFECELLDASTIRERFDLEAPLAILSQGDAEVDAFRLTHKLLERATKRGLRAFDRTEVLDIQEQGGEFVLTTDRDANVFARKLVYATGYESQQYLKEDVGSLLSTFAVVSEPVQPFPVRPGRTLIWETERPYFYLRSTPDDRFMIGGEDVRFSSVHRQDRLLERQIKKLLQRFEKTFPDLEFDPVYSWAGTFGETKDGLAYIGSPAGRPNEFFAVGYGGNGITMSAIAARLIGDAIVGRPNPDAALFRFDR